MNQISAIAHGGATFAVATTAHLQVQTLVGNTVLPIDTGGFGASAIAFSEDGAHFAASTADATYVWRLSDSQLVDRIPAVASESMLAMSSDGSVIVGGGNMSGAVIVSGPGGLVTLSAPPLLVGAVSVGIMGLTVSPDGTLVTVALKETNSHQLQTYYVQDWDATTGALYGSPTMIGTGTSPVIATTLLFSPDGSALFAGPVDTSAGGSEIKPVLATDLLSPSIGPPLDFSNDGARLLTTGNGGIIVLQVSDRTILRTVASPSGSTVAAFGPGTAPNEPVVLAPSVTPAFSGSTSEDTLALSSDGSLVAMGNGGFTSVYEVTTGKVATSWPGVGSLGGPATFTGSGPLAFSPDGSRLARSANNVVTVFTPLQGEKTFSTDSSAFAFSPDGSVLATGNADNTAQLWSVVSATPLLTLTGHTQAVSAVAFSPDGSVLATGSADSTVKLWDTTTGNLLQTLTYLATGKVGLSFTPDGKRLFVLDSSGGISVSDSGTQSFGPLTQLANQVGTVSSFVISASSGVLFGAGQLNEVIRVDTESLAFLTALNTPPGLVKRLALSQDGRMLGVRSADGVVRLWCNP